MRKKIIVAVTLLIAVGVLVSGIYAAWLMTPPDMPTTPEEGLALLTSPRFERLPEYRQKEYVSAIRAQLEELPREERHALIEQLRTDDETRDALREIHREEMMDRMRRFAKATPEEREEILDEAAEEMRRWRAPRPERSDDAQRGGGESGRRRGRGRMREHIEDRVEHGNPQNIGLMREFWQAMGGRHGNR